MKQNQKNIAPAVENHYNCINESNKPVILLGGIGGDSHSVGLTILRQAISESGYRVRYLGTQNRLEDFFLLAPLSNIVMISSLDGHTSYYLREFAEMKKRYQSYKTLWYLGGNLHIGDGNGYESYFREAGFDRVFVKFVDVKTVLEIIEADLSGVEPIASCDTLWERSERQHFCPPVDVSDDLLDFQFFEKARREVLEHWRTGRRAECLEENADFLRRQASFAQAQALRNLGRHPLLIQPRSGVATANEQIRLFKAFKEAGSSALSYQVDSLTRNNNYIGAEESIRDCTASGISTINGFPVINHGVDVLRRIASEVKIPLQTRHSTRDPRLLAEISYAGGVTAFEGGAICYNIPYYKDYPLQESIKAWQYVDRLTGLYYDRFGIALDREFFGTLTATLIPPCLAIVVNILEAIMAVLQGVKCVSLGYAEQGNRIQDIAAIRMLRQISSELIKNMGYKDVQINTVFHQYMAAFPEDLRRAEMLIYNSSITAALAAATRVIIKTPVEALRIPSLEDNVLAINLVNQGIFAASRTQIVEKQITEECDIIRREVNAMLDSVFLCGGGSVARGIITSFQKGFIDIPFSPSIYNLGKVVTARDTEGAVRFLSIGNLQFDRELREFHRSKISDRCRAEGLISEKQSYLLIEQDVLKIPRGQYECWPLFK